ncbi:MAG: hypothetical protein H7255_12990 [Ramlibacter sp.]|nr:hypothetical protein [Ramlibacter sp.]
MGNLHVHVREVFRSDELCAQRDGVNAGAWIQFDDAGDIRARYNERTEWIGNDRGSAADDALDEEERTGDLHPVKEIVVLIGARGLTLRLSDDGNHVTEVIARPPVSINELIQLEIAGVLNTRVLRGAVLQAEPVVIAEVPQAEVAEIDLNELGRRCDNFAWQPQVAVREVLALPEGANNRATIRLNLPLNKVIAINQ